MCLFPIIEVRGDWSTRGCTLVRETEDDVTCQCDHLTSFSILLVLVYAHIKFCLPEFIQCMLDTAVYTHA